jgi:hypothetical protein
MSKQSRADAAVSPLVDTTLPQQVRPDTKQAGVLALLQSASGATIAAIAEQTGWQQHSVRGFLAGVVRKKLKLKLKSSTVDGHRVYRIEGSFRRRSA